MSDEIVTVGSVSTLRVYVQATGYIGKYSVFQLLLTFVSATIVISIGSWVIESIMVNVPLLLAPCVC